MAPLSRHPQQPVPREGVANLHGLARVQREKRWTAILDVVLALSVLAWVLSLSTVHLLPGQIGQAVPVLVGAMVVHRALLAMERRQRERAQLLAQQESEARLADRRRDIRAA